MITLYNGDCFDIFQKIEDKSIDLVVCDMPYGKTKNKWDIPICLNDMWENVYRIAKENAAIILFGQGLFYIDIVNSNRKYFRYDLVWNKVLVSGHLNAKRMPLRSHEQIAIFYKKQPTYNPQFTIGKPLHSVGKSDGKVKETGKSNSNYGKYIATDKRVGSTEKYPISIQTFKKTHASICKHPTEKPVELLELIIKTYSNEGDVVLDFCMGSGSTGVACKNTNRSFIGIEKDLKYFNIAQERIEGDV